jgi:hypothetical protein
MAIAVLALEAGSLVIKNDARRKVLPLEPGLHFLTWCAANMFYMGSPLARPITRPLEQNGEFTIEHVNEEAVTWMKISATFEHRPGPASYVFPVEHAPPSLLACFYSGACPNPRLLTHPAVRLEPYLSFTIFVPHPYYSSFLSSYTLSILHLSYPSSLSILHPCYPSSLRPVLFFLFCILSIQHSFHPSLFLTH